MWVARVLKRSDDKWQTRREKLSSEQFSDSDQRKAMIYGSVLASFNVEAFSLERLRTLTMDEIAVRCETFKAMSAFETLA